jgi:hypothetical protein
MLKDTMHMKSTSAYLTSEFICPKPSALYRVNPESPTIFQSLISQLKTVREQISDVDTSAIRRTNKVINPIP